MTPDKHDVMVEAAKGTPAVAGAIAATLTLNEVVAITTGIYILLQAAYLLWKWRGEWIDRNRRASRRSRRSTDNEQMGVDD